MLEFFTAKFPYTDYHELNLDWIISKVVSMNLKLDNFVNLNTIKYADPIGWDITKQYEANTVVMDQTTGIAYLSSQPVPAGVSISNPNYWSVIFDLQQIIGSINENITYHNDGTSPTSTFTLAVGDWVLWNSKLYKVIQAMSPGYAYVEGSNIEAHSVEELVKELITAIYVYIGELTDLTTSDTTSIVNAINSLVADLSSAVNDINTTIGDLTNLTTSDNTSVVDAINSLVTDLNTAVNNINILIGDLSNLTTSDNTSVVNAINSLVSDLSSAVNDINTTIGDLNDLNTTDRSSIVNAINELDALVHTNDPVYINVKKYGAVGDGITDDSTAISNALTIALTTKLPLYFPGGTYLFSSPVTIPTCDGLTIIGAGRDCATLIGESIFNSINNTKQDHLTIYNLTFRGVTGSTSPLLNFEGLFYHSLIYNCAFYDWYQAIHVYYYLDSKIICCECNEPLIVADSCIIIARNANGSAGANFTIADCLLQGWRDEDDNKIYGKVGVEIRDGDAVYMDNVDMGRFIYNNVKVTAQYRSDNHNFHNCYFDVTKTEHCLLITGTAQMNNISVNNCWFASSSYIDNTNGAGIYCNARGIQNIQITANRFINIAGCGIMLYSDNFVGVISDNQMTNIGTAQIANYDAGIYIETPTSTNYAVVIKNNFIYNAHGYGIALASTVRRAIVKDNQTINCVIHLANHCLIAEGNNNSYGVTASADMSALEMSYDVYIISGTTSIRQLPVIDQNGKIITLVFNDATPVLETGNIRLAGAFTATGGSTLSLISFAQGWSEVSRAIV